MDQIEQLKALRDEAVARIEAAKRAIEEGADGKMVASLDVIIGELEMSKEVHASKQLVSENSPSSYRDIPFSGEPDGNEDMIAKEGAGDAWEESANETGVETDSPVEEEAAMEVQYLDENQSRFVEDETPPVSDPDFPEPGQSREESERGEFTQLDQWGEDPETEISEDVAMELEAPELGGAAAEMVGSSVDPEQPGQTEIEGGELTEAVMGELELAPGEPVPLVDEVGGGDGIPFDCDQFALEESLVEEINDTASAMDPRDEGGVADGEGEAIYREETEGSDVSAVETHEDVDNSDRPGAEWQGEETESAGEVIDSPELPPQSDSQNLSEFPEDAGGPDGVEGTEVANFSATVSEVNASDLNHPLQPSCEDPTRLVGAVPLGSIRGHAPPEPVEVSPVGSGGEGTPTEKPGVESVPESGGQP